MSVLWASIASPAIAESMHGGSDGHIRRNPSMRLLKMVEPVYPKEAAGPGIHGTVIVELLIDRHGLPQKVLGVKGHPALISAVCSAVEQWRWKPYRLNGEAVEMDMMIAVNFEPAHEYADLADTPLPVQLRN